jgi:bisanhydrobacterioruberin hydratase
MKDEIVIKNTPPQLFGIFDQPNKVLFILTILYGVGIIGFVFKIHPDFAYLTPVNLLISLFFAHLFHQNKNLNFYIYCAITAFTGFIIEAIGVNTGKIFGIYQYGPVLGFKIYDTPLSIGINWLLLSYCSAIVVNHSFDDRTNWFLKSILATLLMVSLDVLIEPIAIKTNMWTWANNNIPFQNYIGWFFTALPLQILFFKLIGYEKNKVAFGLLVLQFLFFFFLNLFLL